MITYLLTYLIGFVIIEIKGAGCVRFLNLCRYNNIDFFHVVCINDNKDEKNEDAYQMRLKRIGDFRLLKTYAYKCHIKVKIIRKFGLRFYIHENRKRIGYYAGLFVLSIILYQFCIRIWCFEYEGNLKYDNQTLQKVLSSGNIGAGTLAYDINCDQAEKMIRNSFNDITWVSIDVNGVFLRVMINENPMNLYAENESIAPCNLVSNRNGRIYSIITRSGIPMVKAGDEVSEGTVIISGSVPINNDAEEPIRYEQVAADGDIIIEYASHYYYEVPNQYIRRIYGNSWYSPYIQLGEYRFSTQRIIGFVSDLYYNGINLNQTSHSEKLHESYVEEQQMKLLDQIYLPIYYGLMKERYYDEQLVPYTTSEKEELAAMNISAYIQQLSKIGVSIVENNVKIQKNGQTGALAATVYAEGYFLVHECMEPDQIAIPEEQNMIEETQSIP